MPLNPRQERFVREYLVDCNATQAALRAGYARASARQQGSELLSHPAVSAAIAAGQEALKAKVGLTAEECYQVLADVARNGFKERDRVAASTALLKLQHKVSERIEHSGQVGLAVQISINGVSLTRDPTREGK